MPAKKLNPDEIENALVALNKTCADATWEIRGDKLHKVFVFADFTAAFGFMCKAAIVAEKMNHHPEWCNVYKTVTVDLTTHESGGITQLDFALAEKMEAQV